MHKRLTFYLVLAALVLATLALTGCDDSGLSQLDGDDDGTPTTCEIDSECGHCKACLEGVCGELPCEKNIDCTTFGAGSYCQFGFCSCLPPDGDGEEDRDIDIPDTNGPEISVDPSVLNFGAAIMGDQAKKELNACNVGTGLLQLNSMVIQQNGVNPEDSEFGPVPDAITAVPSRDNIITLAAGDCHEIPMQYLPNDPGIDSGVIYLGTNVGIVEIPMKSEQKGVQNIGVDCAMLDPDYVAPQEGWEDACSFGFVPVNDMVVMPITIENVQTDESGNAVLVITDITLRDPMNPDNAHNLNYELDEESIDYADNGKEIWLAPGEKEEFNIIYSPRYQAVNFLEILIEHDDPDPDKVNPQVIRVVGAGVVPNLSPSPFPIAFGNVEKGTCKTIDVDLCNIGGAELCIDDVALNDTSGAMETIFELNLDPDYDTQENIPVCTDIEDEECPSISLTCCPQGQEAYINVLDIISNHNAMGDRVLTQVPISCTGVEAFCDIWPVAMDFEQVRVGDSVTKTLYIANNGRATSRLQAIDISGSLNFELAIPINFPVDIAPAETFVVDVKYTASTTGCQGADLELTFRDGDCDGASIPLSGCGVQPVIGGPDGCLTWENEQVPPQSIEDDDLDQWITFKPVTITNEGNDVLVISDIFLPNLSPGVADERFVLDLPGDNAMVTIPPGGSYVFNVGYKPFDYGEHSGVVVVCSDAGNTSGSMFRCLDDNANAQEICLVGTAIDPRMYIEPSNGRMTFAGVIVGDDPPAPQLATLSNGGSGAVHIDSIEFGYGSPDITIVSMVYHSEDGDVDLLAEWPAEGVDVAGDFNETIQIAIQCDPQSQGQHYRALEITHNDKDMRKPDGVVGSEFPVYLFEVICYSGENAPPTAVVKSPAGNPPGPYGTRTITINKGDEIVLDGSSSYDPNAPDDTISEYEWTVSDPNNVTFTLAQNVSVTRALFNSIGTYTVYLRVKDTHDSWSDQNFRDSQLEVKVYDAPRAEAYQCDTFVRYVETEVGQELCFDGTHSHDQDYQAVSEYRWFIKKVGGQSFNFSTNAVSSYTFNETGTYEVSLTVLDRFGNESATPAVIDVDVFADESIRIELTWTGRGDVDLHYIRPNGYLGGSSDCNVDNKNPFWTAYGCGNPAFQGDGSTNGVTPEVIEHPNPCDGAFNVTAVYETPSQECGYVTESRHYSDNCDMCGCDCKPFCLILRWCCLDCDIPTTEWVCEDVPAMLTYKMFFNDSPYASMVESGSNRIVRHQYDTDSFTLSRYEGKWLVF